LTNEGFVVTSGTGSESTAAGYAKYQRHRIETTVVGWKGLEIANPDFDPNDKENPRPQFVPLAFSPETLLHVCSLYDDIFKQISAIADRAFSSSRNVDPSGN
jgi:hypothetical protein